MGDPYTGCQILDWEGWELEETTDVNGSVFEFAFGPRDQSYIATSYPYRPQYANDDKRSIVVQNLPQEIWEQIKMLRPRYVMNIAFRRKPSTWVIYCYRGPGRYAYDSKWRPQKPDTKSGKLGATLDEWKKHESDQVSYCAFGDRSDKWFMRSTNGTTEWFSRLGPGAPADLEWSYDIFQQQKANKKSKNGALFSASTVRAVTFGPADTWILYSQKSFIWSKYGLPSSLVTALQEGLDRDWIINKAVLNPFNRNEYVLIYDHGPVYCSFDPNFRDSFNKIIGEWGESMRRYDKWSASMTPSIQWKDPTAVANESFLIPEGDEEEEQDEEEGLRTSTSDQRSPSFSSKHGTQAVNGDMRKPARKRDFSDETQVSQLSNSSTESSWKVVGRATGGPGSVPPTEDNAAENVPFSIQPTLQHTVSSSPVTDRPELESNYQNNSRSINKNGNDTHSQRFAENAKSQGKQPVRNNPALGYSRSTAAPQRVEDQELRIRKGYRSPLVDFQDVVTNRTGQTRVEEAQPSGRWHGVKMAGEGVKMVVTGKGTKPGKK